MKKRTWILFACICVIFLLLTACGGGSSSDGGSDTGTSSEDTDNSDDSDGSYTDLPDHEDEDDYTWDENDVVTVTLNGNSVTIDGSGAVAAGSVITISSAGTYRFTGTLNDGMVKVDTEDEETVTLILNGVNITCSYQAPIQVLSAQKTVVVLADGSENYITDGSSYTFDDPEEDEPNAAIFSKDDLTLYGDGNLTVMANYNDGIAGKDGLFINCGGTIAIDTVDDGIRGKDYLVVKDGTFSITADGDGLKSDNDEDEDAGYIKITGGTFDITAGADAIQAAFDVQIEDGTFTLTTGGGSSYTISDSDSSAKGIKASASIWITGGNFTISSADDCIHSNDTIDIDDGSFLLSSGDDGIHADTQIEIDYADVEITKSYEGIESALITINDGEFIIVSSDDGLNVAGGNDDSANNGRPGQGDFNSSDGDALYINGGFFAITSVGDGLDVNGFIEMTAGTVLIHGPTSDFNGAIDYDVSFTISGGFLVGAGSSGMAMKPGSDSSQSAALLTFNTRQAGTLIHIESQSGASLVTFAPVKAYESLAFSSPDLVSGATYDVYFGGTCTGTPTYGLYTGGTYTGGTQAGSFTAD